MLQISEFYILKTLRRIGRIILIPLIVVLVLLLSLMIAIQIPAVQTKIAKYAVEELNNTFGTEINVERVKIDFFGDVNLYGVTAKDENQLDFIDIKRIQAGLSLTGLISNPNRITIKKLKLFEPNVKVITYKNDSISNFIRLIDRFSTEQEKEPSDFRLSGNIEIENGKVLIRNQNLEPSKRDWVDAENFNLIAKNFKLQGDDIWADIKSWNFEGKRNNENYKVENFSGNLHYSPKEIRIDDWNFKTEDSQLDGHLVLASENEADMSDFLNKVVWDMELKEGSKVNFKDIRYFVTDFDKNTTVDVSGLVTGTLNDMKFHQLTLNGDGVFLASDELNLIDMTEGDRLQIHSNMVKAKTSYREFTNLLPTFISNKIPVLIDRFGNMDYRGSFDLDSDQIKTKGYALTSLGDADLDVVLSDYRNELKYKGLLITQNMNLKQITDVEQLGFVKGRIDFDGQGTDIKYLKLKANGNLAYFDLMDKRYSNVLVNGRLENERFTGYMSIKDQKMVADYDGIFDFSKKPYKLDFVSKVGHLDLDYLGVTDNLQASVSADVEGNFSFSNIDDFLGALELDNVQFKSKDRNLNVPHAHLISSKKGDVQNLELDVPEYLKGEVTGNYKLSQLPDALINAIGSTTLVTYTPKKTDPNQNFHFYFEVEQDLFSLIDSRIQIAPGTIVDGQVDTGSNSLIAELSSHQIGFDGFNIYNPLINVDTSKETEQIYIRTDSLSVKNAMIYNADIHTTPVGDSLMVKTTFQWGKEFPVDFDLNLYQTTDENKNLIIGFSPSSFNVDGNDWQVNPENDPETNRAIINFDKNYYELQNLLIESDGQKLLLDGYFASNTDYKLNADLEKLILSEIIPKSFVGNLEIAGIANGNVNIIRTKDELKPLMELKVEEFGLNGYGLGDVSLNGTYNANQNVFDIELFIEQEQVQVLYANGFIDNKPSTPQINMVASLDDFNFKFVESFLSAAMSNLRGKVSGNVKFSGPIDSPDFEGMLDLANLGFKIDYLNTDYSFDGVNTVPVFKQSGGQGSITLDEIRFRDTVFGTKGEVTGQVLFRDFASWFLNLSFNTDNLLVLNTNEKINDLFYGRVFGQGAFEIFGPPEKLDISANAKVNDGSDFTINTGATKVEGSSSLVRFIPEGEDKEKEEGGPKGMLIDLNISADANSTVHLVFDPVTKDMVTANGSTEDLKFHLGRTGIMTLEGTYTLESGKYQFRQVPLLNRDFEIKSGSYVNWSGGSPLDASMHITANFERTVSNVGEYLGTGYSQTYNVILGIVISESLSNPKMDFTMTIPKGGSDMQSLIDYKFNLDPDDKMIQFGSILLFGQFMTSDSNVFAAGAASAGAGIALKQLGGIINSLIVGGGVMIDLDYVTGSDMSNTSDRFKTDLHVNLSPRWTFNGEVGVPVGSGYTNETATGEAEVQWDVSKKMDKTLVVNFFTRPTNFGVQNFGGAGNFQSFGAGIMYKTTFDRFSEIFKKDSPEARIKSTVDQPSFFERMEQQNQEEQKPEEQEQKIEEKTDSADQKPVSKTKPPKKQKGGSLVRFR